MLTYETLRILKNLFLEIAKGEIKAENLRQSLAKMQDFEPYVAFQRLDRNRNERIPATELLDFLRDNKIYGVSHDEAQYLIDYFDTDNDH